MLKKIKNFIGCLHRANKAEIAEIKGLIVTDEDRKQSEVITTVVMSALGACGVKIVNNGFIEEIIQTSIAYSLRDLKDGLKTKDKLLVNRIIKEIKTSQS